MRLNFKFAVVSDLHIALPHTIWDAPNRFHLVEVSIPAFEQILDQLVADRPDFLLLPGDLVQHGERDNHQWLANRLAQLPFPVYVVPGNHDVPRKERTLANNNQTISRVALTDFPQIYRQFGYTDSKQLYYQQEILPGVHLIGLNSNTFDESGEQIGTGFIDEEQFSWLDAQLKKLAGKFVMVMVHHNVLEHLPNQAKSKLGQRYMIKNAPKLVSRLQAAKVPLAFTGHLHVQDIAKSGNFYAITTGSLVSYPHPYRLMSVSTNAQGLRQVNIETRRVESLADWPTLQQTSKQWMGDRSFPFILRLMTDPPLSLSPEQAESYAPYVKDFWATVAAGDAWFDYKKLPEKVQRYFRRFNAVGEDGKEKFIDNNAVLLLR
ncbi:Ser/Thr protein phosphatase family protein [Synechococcus sp. PCC 7335]|uniref:metallophosphoesterase family protein n=1 Tax=Synechococcus sp. (strain ATCC 29403 / PCC 7335) TaxID=91464 RepID=UPI00017EC01B|nr:metallophosphoesterase [Synechococcus sp. PCC 7335]EDX86134.1 Ser/Thr protein phosphatase family protein [Synechococcus sp. PCC 7335]